MSATLGLSESRAADPKPYQLGHRAPSVALKPGSAEEVAEALRAAAADGLAVLPWGGGTRLRREVPEGAYDVALDLTGLDRVIEYDPEDLTVTAQCGITLATLRQALAEKRQELPLESARADRATLGGVIASNASGPRRLRFGSPRDRILGARFALGDGTLARAGGKVVKNVAGFAVHRLLCGSRGGLGVIVEASLKLLPAPERRLALIYGMSDWQVASASHWSTLPRLEPSYLTVLGRSAAWPVPETVRPDAPFVVAVGLEDEAAWVAEQEAAVVRALGAPAARLEDAAAETLCQALADAEDFPSARLSFTSAHHTPASLGSLLERDGNERLVAHALAGRLHWPVAHEADVTSLVRDLLVAGYVLIEKDGTVRLEAPIPPQKALLQLRARLRGTLDPSGVMALGARWAAARE
jgi:glycolate oxidase FAD binding subunit